MWNWRTGNRKTVNTWTGNRRPGGHGAGGQGTGEQEVWGQGTEEQRTGGYCMGKWSKISETVPGRELLEQNRVRHDVTIYRPQNYNLKTIVKIATKS